MSARNPCGQPLRCRQCSLCTTCFSSVPHEKLSGTVRTATAQNGTSRARRTSSAPKRLASRFLCTYFCLLTSVRISGFLSLSLLIYSRYGPNTCDEKWQKPIRNVLLWYTLWFNFILGSNVIFVCFKLISHIPIPQNKGE